MRPPPIVNLKIGFCNYYKNGQKPKLFSSVCLLCQRMYAEIVYYQKPNIEDVYAHAPLHG